MVSSRNIAAVLLALAPVVGCSVSDHPIPPLDIGSSGSVTHFQSSNTQLASRAEAAPTRQAAYPQSDLSLTRASLPQPPVGSDDDSAISGSWNGVSYAGNNDVSLDERRGSGPRTLESQAARLDPPPAPVAPVSQSAPPVRAASPAKERSIAAVQAGPPLIALAEVSGVGVNAAQPLATEFGKQAKAHNLSFTSASDTKATHVMKGYFTVGDDNGDAVVNYVWDISDLSGKRLHRIQGSEAGGGSGSGWDGVTPGAMQAIADRSIEETARFIRAENS